MSADSSNEKVVAGGKRFRCVQAGMKMLDARVGENAQNQGGGVGRTDIVKDLRQHVGDYVEQCGATQDGYCFKTLEEYGSSLFIWYHCFLQPEICAEARRRRRWVLTAIGRFCCRVRHRQTFRSCDVEKSCSTVKCGKM